MTTKAKMATAAMAMMVTKVTMAMMKMTT